MGQRVLVLTGNLDMVAQMSCNPAIGGVAKGHLVKELDALGGAMAGAIDATGIQFRRLNASKGPAVRSTRAQADKRRYRDEMRARLEREERVALRQGEVAELGTIDDGARKRVCGVVTTMGVRYAGRAVILTPVRSCAARSSSARRGRPAGARAKPRRWASADPRAARVPARAAEDWNAVSARSPHAQSRRPRGPTRR